MCTCGECLRKGNAHLTPVHHREQWFSLVRGDSGHRWQYRHEVKTIEIVCNAIARHKSKSRREFGVTAAANKHIDNLCVLTVVFSQPNKHITKPPFRDLCAAVVFSRLKSPHNCTFSAQNYWLSNQQLICFASNRFPNRIPAQEFQRCETKSVQSTCSRAKHRSIDSTTRLIRWSNEIHWASIKAENSVFQTSECSSNQNI